MSNKTLHIDWIRNNTVNECHYNDPPHKNLHWKTFYDEKNKYRFVGEGDTSEEAMTSMLNLMRLWGYAIIGLDDKIYIRVDKEIEAGDIVRCVKNDAPCEAGDIQEVAATNFAGLDFFRTTVNSHMPYFFDYWEAVHKLKIGDIVLFQGSGPYKVTEFAWDLKETPVLIENPCDYDDCQHVSEEELELYQPEKHIIKKPGTIRTMPTPTSSDIPTSVMHAHNEEIMKLEQNLRKYISSVSTIGKIEAWAKEKSLDKADPKAQLCKLLEEAGELAEGIIKDRPEQVKDSIGDCVVVLTILALQVGLTIEECMDYAYDQIKERTGKMVNGVFVKSEDLKEG